MKKQRATQERVRTLFDYMPNGDLIRKISIRAKCGEKGRTAGCVSVRGYIKTSIDGSSYWNHQIVWLWHNGYFTENELDHINKNKSDNRIENLREVSHVCNIKNRGKLKNNTSGITGVSFRKARGTWGAQICVNYKARGIVSGLDFVEAVCHRLALEQCLGWEGCNSTSDAYLYVKKHVQKKAEAC